MHICIFRCVCPVKQRGLKQHSANIFLIFINNFVRKYSINCLRNNILIKRLKYEKVDYSSAQSFSSGRCILILPKQTGFTLLLLVAKTKTIGNKLCRMMTCIHVYGSGCIIHLLTGSGKVGGPKMQQRWYCPIVGSE